MKTNGDINYKNDKIYSVNSKGSLKDTEKDIIQHLLDKTGLSTGETRFIKYGSYNLYMNKIWVEFTAKDIFQKEARPDESYAEAYYWYGSLTKEEYISLDRQNALPSMPYYGGIGTNANYSIEYCSNKSSDTHIVEYKMIITGKQFRDKLYERFKSEGNKQLNKPQDPKGEGQGGTFGLGNTGIYNGLGRKVFNEMLSNDEISFKLIYFKLPIPDLKKVKKNK